jgi:hypothetical protein
MKVCSKRVGEHRRDLGGVLHAQWLQAHACALQLSRPQLITRAIGPLSGSGPASGVQDGVPVTGGGVGCCTLRR